LCEQIAEFDIKPGGTVIISVLWRFEGLSTQKDKVSGGGGEGERRRGAIKMNESGRKKHRTSLML
jgi:hypothetical protein